MIKQQVFLNNECILTIFHDKFEDYPENKKIKQKKSEIIKLGFQKNLCRTLKMKKLNMIKK